MMRQVTKARFTIGELAREVQLNPKTIRYYEEIGLLGKPRRSESGYRLYAEDELERLRLVKRAKLLGLSLAEIKEIVEFAIDGRCGVLEHRLLSLMEAKLGEIDHKLNDLVTLRGDLQRYHSDLSNRLKSGDREGSRASASAPCQCIGEEADSLGE